MKICHLTSVHTPFDTRIFWKECRSLARAGHEVHLVAGHTSDEERDGVRLHAVQKDASRIKRMLFTVSRVFRKAMEIDADVYHFHDPELVPAGLLLKLRGKRVIYDIHEDYSSWLTFNEGIPPWLRVPAAKVFSWFERMAVRGFDALVTVTPYIQRRFESANRRTVMVRNFPVALEFTANGAFDRPWSEREDALCYIGGITPQRGFREMILALSLVREQRPVRLLLGGDFSPEAQDIMDSLPDGQSDGIECYGWVSRSRIGEIFSRSRIGLVVLHPEKNYLLSYPTKFFEYMSAGLPVICSDFPLFRELFEDVGCCQFVDPRDPRSLSEAILFLLSHPEEAEAMGARGKRAVENMFSWEREEESLLKLYEQVLRR